MTRTSPCTCGLLEWHARNAAGVVTREGSGGYALQLTPRRAVRIAACWFCGGYEREERGFYRGGAPCRCGAPLAWATDMFLPVQFDRSMSEYSMPSVGLFYYCVVCGGRLPPSRRHDLFTQPAQPEVADFMQRTAALRSLEDVRRALGEPDYDSGFGEGSATGTGIEGCAAARRQIAYENRWDTLQAVFQETEDGALERFFGGKYAGPPESAGAACWREILYRAPAPGDPGAVEILHRHLGIAIHRVDAETLRDAELSHVELAWAYLDARDLRRANLAGARLERASLRGACLDGAVLSGAGLAHAALDAADLKEADLRSADLRGATLVHADLNGADLRGADLREADLYRASLPRANLAGGDLRGASLLCAYARGANLEAAQLERAVIGADLSHAGLRGANLCGASLAGADLSHADLRGAVYNSGTVWPRSLFGPRWRGCIRLSEVSPAAASDSRGDEPAP